MTNNKPHMRGIILDHLFCGTIDFAYLGFRKFGLLLDELIFCVAEQSPNDHAAVSHSLHMWPPLLLGVFRGLRLKK